MSGIIRLNFQLSVLAIIIGFLLLFAAHSPYFSESLSRFKTYNSDILISGALLGVFSLFGWYGSYRHDEGHLMAFCIGFMLLIPVFGELASGAINQISFTHNKQYILSYIGISHLLYGLVNWQEVLKGLGRKGY